LRLQIRHTTINTGREPAVALFAGDVLVFQHALMAAYFCLLAQHYFDSDIMRIQVTFQITTSNSNFFTGSSLSGKERGRLNTVFAIVYMA
jgi:hypothetical protein